jgi:hypothetical protein
MVVRRAILLGYLPAGGDDWDDAGPNGRPASNAASKARALTKGVAQTGREANFDHCRQT